MSIQAVAYAIDLRQGPCGDPVTPQEKLLLICLANRVNPDHGNRAWPAIDLLAQELGRSERRVQELLVSLEDKGLVARVAQRDKSGRQKTNSYRLPDFERGRDTANPGDARTDEEEAQEQETADAIKRRDADESTVLTATHSRMRGLAPGGADGVTPSGADSFTPGVRTGSPQGADSFTQTVRVITSGITVSEEQEELSSSARAPDRLGDHETVPAEDARPIPVVEDDFVPTRVTAAGRRQEQIEAVVLQICGHGMPTRDDDVETLVRRVQGRLRRGEVRPGEVVAAVDRIRERQAVPA